MKYAIAIFQDENLDGKMNTNFLGKLTERSGFSNNVNGSFGPPDFEDASFDVIYYVTVSLIINLK